MLKYWLLVIDCRLPAKGSMAWIPLSLSLPAIQSTPMKKLISFERAGRISLSLYLILIVFHLMFFLHIIPVEIIWGGRFSSYEEAFSFELIALVVQVLAAVMTAVMMGYLGSKGIRRLARVFMWVLFVLFSLNTLGNLLAITLFEKFFAVVTLVLAFCSLRLALEKIK